MVYNLNPVDYLCVQMDNHGIRSLSSGLSLRTDRNLWYTIFIEWIISAYTWTIMVYDHYRVDYLCIHMDNHGIRSLVSGSSLRIDGQPWYTIFIEWIISAYRRKIMVYDLYKMDYLCVHMDNHGIRSLSSGLSLHTDGQSWYTIFIEWTISACRWTIMVYDLYRVDYLCVQMDNHGIRSLASGLSLRADGQSW